MSADSRHLSSLNNPRVKSVVKLRQRANRDEAGLLLIEGCRELQRALEAKYVPAELFFCRDLFQDHGEAEIIRRCQELHVAIFECSEPVFRKMAYRDHPEALLATGPSVGISLADLTPPERALLLVIEAVEKPGNLGTMLRSADAAGVDGVIVCDACTDINNPNVVRSSMGTLFSQSIAVASSEETLTWLQKRRIQVLAATPDAEDTYTSTDMCGPIAIAVGTEKHGLSAVWMAATNHPVRIPMHGIADSLNVSAAATLLLYEAVRQRAHA